MGNTLTTQLDQTSSKVGTIIAHGDDEYSSIHNALKPKNYVSIWSGNFQTFALDNKNNLYSWGLNNFYQLGNGKVHNYLPNKNTKRKKVFETFSHINKHNFPIESSNIKKIACGDGFSGFLTHDGNVYSVGKNDKCQLGYALKFKESKVVSGVKCQAIPRMIEAFSAINIIDIACGSDFAFAVDDKARIYSWGSNVHKQLAQNTRVEYIQTPTIASLLPINEMPRKIVCGWMHGAMLTQNGFVFIWGNPFFDYSKSINDFAVPIMLPLTAPCFALSSGFHHGGIIVNEQKPEGFMFGINDFGQCGISSKELIVNDPIKIEFPSKVTDRILDVQCGAFHTICRGGDSLLYGFGQNDNQQIGKYESDTLEYPTLVNWDSLQNKGTQGTINKIICGNAFTYICKSAKNVKNHDDDIMDENTVEKTETYSDGLTSMTVENNNNNN